MNGIRPKIVEFVKTSAEKVPFAAKNRTVAYPTAGHPTEKNVEFFNESAKNEPLPSLVRETRRQLFAPKKCPNSRENAASPPPDQENPVSPPFIFGNNSPTRENPEKSRQIILTGESTPHENRQKNKPPFRYVTSSRTQGKQNRANVAAGGLVLHTSGRNRSWGGRGLVHFSASLPCHANNRWPKTWTCPPPFPSGRTGGGIVVCLSHAFRILFIDLGWPPPLGGSRDGWPDRIRRCTGVAPELPDWNRASRILA